MKGCLIDKTNEQCSGGCVYVFSFQQVRLNMKEKVYLFGLNVLFNEEWV